jgi:hypothetical protein
MAPEHDELNRRREDREARRKQRQAEQRKLRTKIIIAAAVLLACGVAIFFLAGGGDRPVDREELLQETQAKCDKMMADAKYQSEIYWDAVNKKVEKLLDSQRGLRELLQPRGK